MPVRGAHMVFKPRKIVSYMHASHTFQCDGVTTPAFHVILFLFKKMTWPGDEYLYSNVLKMLLTPIIQ